MAFLLRTFILLVFLLPPLAAGAEQKPFSHPGVANDAQRYEAWLKNNWKPDKAKAGELKLAAEKALAAGNDARGASRSFAAAVVSDEGDAEAWLGLARALLAIEPDPNQGSERYELPVNASGAAYRGYERAQTPALKARALAALGEALKRRSYWRPALEALKASLVLVDDAATRQAFEALRAEHGFRLVDYTVDSEAATPRLCLQLSEPLARGQIDFSKFVSVAGKDPQSVAAQGSQLCVEALVHGQRYEVTVRAGLPSENGESLSKAAELAIYVRDRAPAVRTAARAYVLPSKGQQGIPLVTVNVSKVALEIYRIGDRALASTIAGGDLQRPLPGYEVETLKERTGAQVYKGSIDVASRLNEEVTTAVPVGEAIPELKPGVYALVAAPADQTGGSADNKATQWFIVSDLGLTALAGDNGLHTFVRSLSTAEPVAGISVRLVARNNEILGQAKTNTEGYARFEAGLGRGEGGMAPAVIVAEAAGGDYAFLDLTAAAFDLTDRGVKGREAGGPIDGFLYTERGIYRPGKEVHLTALVRDRSGRAVGVPVTLAITRPDGVEHRRLALTDQGLGGRTTTLGLGDSAMTGTWRARIYADPKGDPIAAAAFLVEDFVPERLELKLVPAVTALTPEVSAEVNVAGRYLYGPPAVNLALEGEVVVKPSAKDVDGFPGYRFGHADEKISPVRKPLEGLPLTGPDGRAAVNVLLPAVPRAARPLEADIRLRLREPGGRAIERAVTLPIDLRQPRIGIKPLFPNQSVAEGETASFDVVLAGADGTSAAGRLTWALLRLDQSWQWYNRDGQWTYEAVTLTRKVASGAAEPRSDGPARIAAPTDSGRYRLEVTADGAPGAAASVIFTAGWHADAAADSPEMLDIALDRPSYKPGDTAKLKIATRHAGKALIAVLGNGLLLQKQVEIAKGGAEVPIEVGADWGAGAYVTAMLYRPLDEAAKRMPGRALGVKWLGLDQTARTLRPILDVPAKIASGGALAIPVKLEGLAAGEEARVAVAAVDAGILNLTRYQAPAPDSWFYGQRQLGAEIRDLYGRLIDGMRAERGRLRSGGDAGGGMAMQGSSPAEQTVALFSGIVRVGPDGSAKVDFKLPDFNGSVRVMAVAWSADKLGHATAEVIVRDPVALLASAPRVLTLGDEARLELDLHNVEGPAAAYQVHLEQESAGGAKAALLSREIALAGGERKAERVKIRPQEVGRAAYDIRVTGPNGIEVKRRLSLDVKPPAGDIRRTVVSQLAPKGGKLTLTPDLVQDLIASRARVSVSIGPAAALDVPGLLAQLDRYPYGCAEQTVSRALPLLYANQLAGQSSPGHDPELKGRIQKAIERVFEMQESSGAFGVWGPHGGDIWLTGYVADFLTRASEAGYAVNPRGIGLALDRLQNYLSYAQDFEKGGEERAYALYVLARNRRAPIGDLRYYADTRLDRFATPLAQAHLGAALAMLGDRERAEKVFRTALSGLAHTDAAGSARLDFGSPLRDSAAVLTLAAETRSARAETANLPGVVAQAFSRRGFTSTQEQAWLLLAAKALGDQGSDTLLQVNGASHRGPFTRTLTAAELEAGALAISNEGEAAVDAVISVNGAALTPEPAVAKGFKIERSYYTLEGQKIDLKSADGGSATLKQTDRLVVVLKVEAAEPGGRILLVDRLPAGLEIENPRLVESGDLKSLEWLKPALKPEHTEFRDDRLVAAFNFFGGGAGGEHRADGEGGDADGAQQGRPVSAATVAYLVRAVTPGAFVHPAATVEDMYRPERHARTAAGRLEVTAQE